MDKNNLVVVPLHKHQEYLSQCCTLINAEWKRSETARLRSLQSSSDFLPVNLILIQNKTVIGHLKLSKIPSKGHACFVESVVIDRQFRGQGYGSILMKEAEKHCQDNLHLKTIYLSTKGQELFYEKLGYAKCDSINIYGGFVAANYATNSVTTTPRHPVLPPLLNNNIIFPQVLNQKTYMIKYLNNNHCI